MTRQAEVPIGTITFKYKAAQRRFVDRVLWDRLQKTSPVYDGDFIRTAELSEATVTFNESGTVISLPENSLIQLHSGDGDIRVDINEGEVGASAGDSALVLVSGESQVRVETGGVITAGTADGDLTLRVMEGTVAFAGPEGTGTVAAGETVALNEAGSRILREATALSPRLQARFLNPNPGKLSVPFRWNRVNLAPEEMTLLEIALDRAFSRIVFGGEFAGDGTSVELDPGSYFWRVSLANSEEAAAPPNILSFKVLSAPAPILITPVEGYRYQFRSRKPSVRFQWTETEEAAYYVLEAANNPGMANPALFQQVRGTSFDFPGLGAGTWHWRVRPVFNTGYEGTAGIGLPASFTIVQSGDLRAPEPKTPQDQGMVNISTGQEDVYFSWKPETEASSYRIRISTSRDLSNPIIDERVRDNFYAYQPGRKLITPRQYYWAVLQTDIEGNDSVPSPARSFVALEGELIQRLTFPPEGYVVEAAMLPDIRFTWRTNLPFQTRFQISNAPGFSSSVIDEPVGGTAFQGHTLPEGTWHWRIRATEPGGMVFETPPRAFTVAPPLAAPLLLEPGPDARALIQEGKPLEFSWAATEGAEYYQLRVYYGGNRSSPVYENNLVEGTREGLSMTDRPDGIYHWTVRGLAPESPRNARRTGMVAEGGFVARRIQPVSLDYPANDVTFDGLRAYYEPETLRWSSRDEVGASSFILSSRSDLGGTPVMLVRNPPQRITLPRLSAGTYYWTIRAESSDGYDISAAAPGRFRVLPIPLLPLAANRLPTDGKVIGSSELRTNRRIVFSWDAVAGATGYVFSLASAETGRIIAQQGPMPETTWTLTDLTLLDVGTFVWWVEAVVTDSTRAGRGASATMVRRGETSENRLTIDFTLPGAPKLQDPGVLYGRE